MTTLTIPTVGFIEASFGLEYNTQAFESPFSKSIQTLQLPGARWKAQYRVQLYKYDSEQLNNLRSFFSRLRGRAGRFYAFDPLRVSPLGTGNGTPVVKGTSQTGYELETDGWASSETVLKTGDLFEVNGELKEVTADVFSDSGGNATLSFEPSLRAAPADNAPITISTPKCTMALDSDTFHYFTASVDSFYRDITFSGVEIFS